MKIFEGILCAVCYKILSTIPFFKRRLDIPHTIQATYTNHYKRLEDFNVYLVKLRFKNDVYFSKESSTLFYLFEL